MTDDQKPEAIKQVKPISKEDLQSHQVEVGDVHFADDSNSQDQEAPQREVTVSPDLLSRLQDELRDPESDPSLINENSITVLGVTFKTPDYSDYVAPEKTFNCPRRAEHGHGYLPDEDPQGLNDFYYDPDNCCTFCGSLNPDYFMWRLQKGDVRLVPTDKDYKVYVQNRGGEPFKQTRRDDMSSKFYGYGHPAHNWITEDADQVQFNFKHLDERQKIKFVELLNNKQIVFAEPFHFYVKPFFITVEEKEADGE